MPDLISIQQYQSTKMKTFTIQSLRQRCNSMINKIKEIKENCSQFPLPAIPNGTFQKQQHSLKEADIIQTVRVRSYANWPHVTPSNEAMSSSGWFYCNVNDRVICIYCDTICYKWINTDDPHEAHARLAPTCPFILSISSSAKEPPSIITHYLEENFQPRHPSMREMSKRQETFNNNNIWTQTSPSVDDLIQAGFYYSGVGNTVTCFYCGGSLHKWGTNDIPKIEHVRWFPDCLYAKHLCSDQLYARVQIKKKQLALERASIDKSLLERLVNARLDLPIVRHLRTQYQLSIIKRCIEDQWKIYNDDFPSDVYLKIACVILQKQIDICRGNPDKIKIPSQGQISNNLPQTLKRKFDECLICLTEERQLACMPCGHVCACVICGYSLHSCPLCREKIQSFIRIYC